MAHVIAKSPKGPRGKASGGEDLYENLVLLCPTHHREVDKAPAGIYPASTLLEWKKQQEMQVEVVLAGLEVSSRSELGRQIRPLLTQNHVVWNSFGPDSSAARANPLSNLHALWTLRKLAVIVPNNRRVANLIKRNAALFENTDYKMACTFIEHAEAFERNCYERTEAVPRFPTAFEQLITDYAEIK